MLAACDRNLEPFDPAEQPRQPDLSKIFPAGAEGAPAAPEPSLELPPPPAACADAPALAAESGEPIRGTLRLAPELQGGAALRRGALPDRAHARRRAPRSR